MAPTKKTILTVAVTGNLTTVQQNPALPCTPEQIANAALESAKVGAAIAHIHVRHPDGRPSTELAHYREVVERIRDKNSELIINLTTGPGGRFVPSKDDPKIAGPGTSAMHPPEARRAHRRTQARHRDARSQHDVVGRRGRDQPARERHPMANEIQKAGSKPELEVFDSGDIQLAHALLEQGVIKRPPLFQIVMGVRYGFVSTPRPWFMRKSLLPEDADWAAFAIGRWEFPMLAHRLAPGRPCARRHGGQRLSEQGQVDAEQRRAVREGGAHSRRHRRRTRHRQGGAADSRAPELTQINARPDRT